MQILNGAVSIKLNYEFILASEHCIPGPSRTVLADFCYCRGVANRDSQWLRHIAQVGGGAAKATAGRADGREVNGRAAAAAATLCELLERNYRHIRVSHMELACPRACTQAGSVKSCLLM